MSEHFTNWREVRIEDDIDLTERDDLRDRIEFVRDDMGDWYAYVQHDGRLHGYMHGATIYRVPDDMGEALDEAHERYGQPDDA